MGLLYWKPRIVSLGSATLGEKGRVIQAITDDPIYLSPEFQALMPRPQGATQVGGRVAQ